MPSFRRIEIWSEVSAGSGVRVADFGPEALATAVLKQPLTGVEELRFSVNRAHAGAAELIHGRIARVCWSDATLDTEWRLAEDTSQSGASDRGQVSWTAQALMLDLARAPYFAFDSAGRPTFDFSATQLTATQWLAYVVAACAAAPLPYTVAVGTVDLTNTFDLSGDFATALELVRAIQQPGRAPGDFVFRRNGSTDYKLDILASRGSTATTVRVQTARNLLENVRKRTLVNLGTKIVPRGKQGCATRDLSQTKWYVTVVDGTHADLSDPYGGANPCAFTDQLTNLYVARIASTFSSQVISASTTAGRITVASTAGWSTGDYVRLFRTSTSAGERVISLSHPTRVVSPASGGYGPITRILDMPTGFGDTNLVANPWLNTWSNSANAPDGYTRSSTIGSTWSRDTTVLKIGTYSQKIANGVSSANAETTRLYTGTCTPYTTSGLRFSASVWYYCESVSAALQRYVRIRVMKPDLSVSYADGDYVDPAEIVGQWTRLSVSNVDLSAATSGVVVMCEVSVNNDPNGYAYHTSYFGPFTLSESDVPIEDVLYSGGIAMWQRANVLLGTISTPIAGYQVRVADLARLDNSDWADEPLTLGGSIEVVDTDLSDTTTQRVVDIDQNLLNPLDAAIQLQTADPLLTSAIAGSTGGSTINGSTNGTPTVVAAPATKPSSIRDLLPNPDVYTKDEMIALLAGKASIGSGGQGTGVPLDIGGITRTAAGTYQTMATGGAATTIYNLPTSKLTAIRVYGYDATSAADDFVDEVIVSTFGGGAVGVVSSVNVRGTPRARTYSLSASAFKLALGGAAGNTYNLVLAVQRASAA